MKKQFDVKVDVSVRVYPRQVPMSTMEDNQWKNIENRANLEGRMLGHAFEGYIKNNILISESVPEEEK